jgi:urease accessory protein
MAVDEPGARSLRGNLALRFRAAAAGTMLAEARRTPPFQVQRLLRLDPRRPALVTAIVQNATAGVFAGDLLCLDVTVERGAAVAIATPAATRVYGMPEGSARVDTLLRIEPGGYLEFLPEPLVLCRDACLKQRTTLCLERGGLLAYGEVLVFGRMAYGERHAYRGLVQRTELRVDGDLVLVEQLDLERDAGAEALGMLGRYAAYGSMVLVCPEGVETDLLTDTRLRLADAWQISGGASLLSGVPGVAVRALGDTSHAASAMLKSIAAGFREVCLPLSAKHKTRAT